jgi:hypothetical protein
MSKGSEKKEKDKDVRKPTDCTRDMTEGFYDDDDKSIIGIKVPRFA